MNVKKLFCLIITLIVMFACTNEDLEVTSEVKKEEAKERIISLAEKYDIKVDFFEINPSISNENEMSFEEIEELFRSIKQFKEHPVELEIYKEKEENGCVLYSTKRQNSNTALVKTRGEIGTYSFSEWLFNLLWFNVTLMEQGNNVNVSTNTSGLSIYSYSQDYGSGYSYGNNISFSATGLLKATVTQVVGFNLTYVLNSSGSYDKSAGKGTVSVSYR